MRDASRCVAGNRMPNGERVSMRMRPWTLFAVALVCAVALLPGVGGR